METIGIYFDDQFKIGEKIDGGYKAVIFRTSDIFSILIENSEFLELTKYNEISLFRSQQLGGKNGKIKTSIATLESTNTKYNPNEELKREDKLPLNNPTDTDTTLDNLEEKDSETKSSTKVEETKSKTKLKRKRIDDNSPTSND